MGKIIKKTKGGVSDHAVQRVIKQYSCQLGKIEIRRLIREEKKISGVGNNGFFIFSEKAVKKMRLVVESEKILVGIVSGGTVVTIEDKKEGK